MVYRDYLDYLVSVERTMEIGEIISRELDMISLLMRKNVEDIERFLEDTSYKCNFMGESLFDFVTESVKKSESKIIVFAEELEKFSNFDSTNNKLDVDSNFLERLSLSRELNIFLRIEIEEYISNLEDVKDTVDEIINSLNKQITDSIMGSRMLM